MYSKKEIRADYDAGFSLETISDKYKKSQEIDFQNKITSKKSL